MDVKRPVLPFADCELLWRLLHRHRLGFLLPTMNTVVDCFIATASHILNPPNPSTGSFFYPNG